MMELTRTEMFDVKADAEAMFQAWIDTGEIIWVSKPLGGMFGYLGAGELEGEEIELLVPPEKREMHRKIRGEYLKNPGQMRMGERGMEILGCRKDGTKFRIEISLLPVRVRKRWLMLGTILDMTVAIPPVARVH